MIKKKLKNLKYNSLVIINVRETLYNLTIVYMFFRTSNAHIFFTGGRDLNLKPYIYYALSLVKLKEATL